MNIEILKMILLKGIAILSLLIGVFLIIIPNKLIVSNLNENNFKDKKKYVYYKRLFFLIIGLIFITNSLLFFLGIIPKGDFALIFGVIALICQLGNLIISKKYLF